MKMIRANEKAILTAEEKAILDKAYDILDNIFEECECEDGDLCKYASDAKDELGYFLNDGENSFYEVEETTQHHIVIDLYI